MIDPSLRKRARGCAVGAAAGDALGMPLEFGPRRPLADLVRKMKPGRLPAGSFTDDTEMALALAESLLAHHPLDPHDLARRFVAWYDAGPADVGIHIQGVLSRVSAGEAWHDATAAVQQARPDSAGNGSVMRAWPVALANWNNLARLIDESRLQSELTHMHPECVAGSAFLNATIHGLLHDAAPDEAVRLALDAVEIPQPLRDDIRAARYQNRDDLNNSGWVRHTVQNAVWGLLTTATFEEAVVQVANLGDDADTAAAVVGALAGAAHGLDAIPVAWRKNLQGEWPLRSRVRWNTARLSDLADHLLALGER